MSHFSSSAVEQLIDGARIPGRSMTIVSDGSPAMCITAGLRNSRDRIAVDPQTVFAAASLSKPLFAYGVLQLIDGGKQLIVSAFWFAEARILWSRLDL